uniref:Muscle-specific homeobox-like homeobox protein-like n=1 Tax=Saccoglossus kowalevskii TaxID=10224 RepID=A0A0U2T5T4_SACKO|nr:muscle-specific homeobox-like homeobox protein-like [Saccoglossus kowalevskii]
MAYLSPTFSGDLAYFESHHTRSAIIPSAFCASPALPPFYSPGFASNFINFASAFHGPRYSGISLSMERDHLPQSPPHNSRDKNRKSTAATTTSTSATTSTASSSSSSPSTATAAAASSSNRPSSSSGSTATTGASTSSQSCSNSFSIDSILGRNSSSRDRDSDKSGEFVEQQNDKSDTSEEASSSKLEDDDGDGSNPMARFSWLQCTRYKPPRLPRVKKKDGTKKRKLGRNPRVPFSAGQVAMLEQKFRRTHYLSSIDVSELSAALSLSENRVKIWFQNRRARERRDRENMEKSGTRAIPWTGGQGASANPVPPFSQAVQEGTSAFTPVSYNY